MRWRCRRQMRSSSRLWSPEAIRSLASARPIAVFIFSDSEFYQADWDSVYEVICGKFEECGYRSCMSEIVFWNLRAGMGAPVCLRAEAKGGGASERVLKEPGEGFCREGWSA